METKSLLIGISSFIAGGLLVSIAAVTFEKDKEPVTNNLMSSSMQMTADSLKDKKGEDFDKAFLAEMTIHHQGAINMAKLAEANAQRSEVKQLSKDILAAQEKEIGQMKQWQKDWGYSNSSMMSPDHSSMGHR